MSEQPIPELKPNPFAHFSAKRSSPTTIQSTLGEVVASETASVKSSSARKKRKRTNADLPTTPATVLSADEQPSIPPTKHKKKYRKDRAESEFPNILSRSEVPLGMDSRERAASSPPIIHRESKVHHGFLGTS